MLKSIIVLPLTLSVMSLLASCAHEPYSDAATAKDSAVTVASEADLPAAPKSEPRPDVMNEPVDFSSPERVQESLQKIRDQAGENKAKTLENALQFILFYDLSVGNDKDRMYKKLDGLTPVEIIAMMKR